MVLSRKEWDAILVARDVDEKLADLEAQGVIGEVFPEIQAIVGFGGAGTNHKDLWWHTKLVVKQTRPEAVLRWAALFHDVGKPSSFEVVNGEPTFRNHEAISAHLFWRAAKRVGFFSYEEESRIKFIINHLGDVEAYDPVFNEWSDSAVRRLSKKLGDRMEDVFAVARADITTGRPDKRRRVMRLTAELYKRVQDIRVLDEIPPALPHGLGTVLQQKTGVKGPALGVVMNGLKARVEAGELPRNADHDVYLKALDLL